MKVANSQKTKKGKFIENKNVLETINSIGSQTVNTIKDEAKATSEEFFRQLLGEQRKLQQKKSTELPLGKTLNMNEFVSGETKKTQKLEEQIFFERRLFNEEKQETQKRIQELRVRLQAIQMEASKLVASTVNLSENVKVAVMQGSVSASEYQIGFFESIVQMIVSFRKKIDNAVDWLQNSNKRAEKKNYWSQYKKKGTSFLLSGESYSQRSAG
ncbi:MAG TPA: DUF5660 family protein [Patescibacteria group bacterium]|nr:DUF5660 family protein [Patescibacteria group bacterium]